MAVPRWITDSAVVLVALVAGTVTNALLGVTTSTTFTVGLIGGLVTFVTYILLRLAVATGRPR